MIGSVHHIDGIPIDYGHELFDKAVAQVASEGAHPTTSQQEPVLEPLVSLYLDRQLEVMERFHPEIIGHFDLFRLYYPAFRLSEAETPEVWAKIRRNVEFAVGYGALFELNAAAFRKGWDQAYPGKEIAEVQFRFISFREGVPVMLKHLRAITAYHIIRRPFQSVRRFAWSARRWPQLLSASHICQRYTGSH